MKKFFWVLVAIVLLLSFTACGEKKEDIDLGGTWKVNCIEYDGSKFSVAEWKNMDEEDLTGLYIIFKDGGKAYIYEDGYGDLVNWLQSEDSVMIGDEKASIVNGLICLDYYGDMLYFEKTSDSQEIPNEDENSEETIADIDITTTPTQATQTTTTKVADKTQKTNTTTLDADFKAAMDSYENFMNEYVAFMKKYKNNPGDLSLLSDYADYMSKYAEFVESFEDWESEDMNAAEMAYYLDVQSRVSKKLLEVTY